MHLLEIRGQQLESSEQDSRESEEQGGENSAAGNYDNIIFTQVNFYALTISVRWHGNKSKEFFLVYRENVCYASDSIGDKWSFLT